MPRLIFSFARLCLRHPGSREWIGAIELSYVLQERYDVACKILTVASGAELPSKAREIARHFNTQVRAHASFMPAHCFTHHDLWYRV